MLSSFHYFMKVLVVSASRFDTCVALFTSELIIFPIDTPLGKLMGVFPGCTHWAQHTVIMVKVIDGITARPYIGVKRTILTSHKLYHVRSLSVVGLKAVQITEPSAIIIHWFSLGICPPDVAVEPGRLRATPVTAPFTIDM
jgi:hypothetical protein